jgi:methylase of polypeptide subunit release factors
MHGETTPAPAATTIRFGSLTIAYDDRVLMPRPWTTLQSEWARELLASAPDGPVLELCSGVGHIGLLAVAGTTRRLVCVDRDPVACAFAEDNARAAGLQEQVEVRTVELRDATCDELFPLVIADPPWVRTGRVEDHPRDPIGAIDGGPDGLELARECLRVIERCLAPGGDALLQLGSVEQAVALAAELTGSLRLAETRTHADGVVVRIRCHRERVSALR